MATSGSFTTSKYKNLSMMFEWSVKSQSVEKNTTTISWSLKGYRTDGAIGMITCGGFKVVINDTVVHSQSQDDRVNVYNGTVVASGTHELSHDSEGNKSFSVSVEAAIYYWAINSYGSGSFSLPQIPRVSVPTLSASNVNFGSEITIYTNRKSSSFTHHLYYSVNGGAEVGITPDIGTSFTWTVPYDLMSNIPNAKSATITFRLYTFNGETNIGNNTIKFTASVPNNATTKPSVAISSLLPVSTLPSPLDTLYVQGKSKVQAKVTYSGKYGASIKSCVMTIDSGSYDASDSYTSGYLSGYGEKTVTVTATDSRGLSNSVSQKITVIAYSSPKINVSTCRRCDADGNLSDSGTYLKIVAKRTYSKVMSGSTQNNFCLIRYRYKLASATSYSAWTTILAKNSLGSDTVTTGALLGTLSATSSYWVQIHAIDDVGEYAETEFGISTASVHSQKTKNGQSFGKYCEGENLLDVGWDINVNGNIIHGVGNPVNNGDAVSLGYVFNRHTLAANTTESIIFSKAASALITAQGAGGVVYMTLLYQGYGIGGTVRSHATLIQKGTAVSYGILNVSESTHGIAIFNNSTYQIDIAVIPIIGSISSIVTGTPDVAEIL